MEKGKLGFIPHHRHLRLLHLHRLPVPRDKTDQWDLQDLPDPTDQRALPDHRVCPDHPAYRDIQETPQDPQAETDLLDPPDQLVVEARLEIWGRWEPPVEQVAPDSTWENGREK